MAKKRGSHLEKIKYQPSYELSVITGDKLLTRAQVVKKVWEYIKANDLQDGRIIHPNEELAEILGSKPIDMLKMQKKLSEHLERVS